MSGFIITELCTNTIPKTVKIKDKHANAVLNLPSINMFRTIANTGKNIDVKGNRERLL